MVHDLPGVGQNLQDHLQFRLMYRVSKPITTNDDLRTLSGQARIGLKWLINGSGPLGIGINQGGLFTRVLPGSATPDIQFHFATLSAELPAPSRIRGPGALSRFASCGLNRVAASRSDRPIQCSRRRCARNYLAAEKDRLCAVESIKYARRLAATDALKPYIASEYKPGAAVQSDSEILEFARENGATIFHPTGTCKMGADSMAVTDVNLRVHGIAGLRVVDCSIMPTLVSGNTHAPAVMIAEKASDMILAATRDQSIAA